MVSGADAPRWAVRLASAAVAPSSEESSGPIEQREGKCGEETAVRARISRFLLGQHQSRMNRVLAHLGGRQSRPLATACIGVAAAGGEHALRSGLGAPLRL
jgi:hypothetical protein